MTGGTVFARIEDEDYVLKQYRKMKQLKYASALIEVHGGVCTVFDITEKQRPRFTRVEEVKK